jgi:hypothetical protein
MRALMSARSRCPGGDAQMPVATAKEERGASAIEVLVLLKERRRLMHAPPPRRTSSSGSRCVACVRTGALAGRAGGLGGVAVALVIAAEGW